MHDNETLTLRVFYDNDEAPNLGIVATGVRLRVLLPLRPVRRSAVAASLESGDSVPAVVSDTVTFEGPRPFAVDYVPGSARLWTNALHGRLLSDSVIGRGTLIGYRALPLCQGEVRQVLLLDY